MLRKILSVDLGKHLSDWERQHILSTEQYAGPICMDTATVFRINEKFMEVTDPAYFQKQNIALAGLLSLGAFGFVMALWVAAIIHIPKWETIDYWSIIPPVAVFGMLFLLMTIYFCRNVFFSLRRYPIRFSRERRKISAFLPRKYFGGSSRCGKVVEFTWDDANVIYCIYRGKDGSGEYLNIRCYRLDGDKRILSGFSIGRRWELDDISIVLAQWNFWCMYMREGLVRLPVPPVYLSENENMSESFFICLYAFGFSLHAVARLIIIPLVLLLFIARRLSVWTCCDPNWPAEFTGGVSMTSEALGEPRGGTPVGWKETIEARHKGTYPENPHLVMERWNDT